MHKLPSLPYTYDALEPHIDAKTMEIHHSKHHQIYVDKLNEAVKGTEFENVEVTELLKDLSKVPENIRTSVRNHGGGHFNHSIFWQIMCPLAKGISHNANPESDILKKLTSAFGSFDKFKEQFSSAAIKHFGSGWAWLVVDNGKLAIMSMSNQDTPISDGKIPILCIDVWEHAYYLKWQNKKADYINSWWNVVNWENVNMRLKEATQKYSSGHKYRQMR